MLIKDILREVARLLGRNDLINFIDTPAGQAPDTTLISEIEKLVGLANMTIQELAITYVPMEKSETKQVTNGKILYSALSQKPVRIKNVYDANGNYIPFVIHSNYIELNGDSVAVEYEFLPPTYTYSSTVDYDTSRVPVYVLALGIIGEYCLSVGWFSEAVMWHNRYVNEARKLLEVHNTSVKQRSWV